MNRLAHETSPYLRQHADNPVDWFPWGEEALTKAAVEDKPLFVSIGYAACHWCHVMAHESFEDPEVAARLAETFVSVKVDREERPDLDAIYMAATLAQNGSGGWPMSVFCTPDGRPFFAGTYFPRTDRGGHPGFLRVLDALGDAWRGRRAEVEEQADQLARAAAQQVTLADELVDRPRRELPTFGELLEVLVSSLARGFDEEWGGFGGAPKFPRPTLVELCLRHHQATGDPGSLAMATRTLDAMAAGGIYDHLAGGFARYSTDREWLVPHFEKMLTDQALLARAYLHAWQVTGRADYRQVMAETLDAMLSELRAPNGGLCSSIDADAGGKEGAHATFTRAELESALVAAGLGDRVEEVAAFYGVTDRGNWEGTNVLRRPLGAPLARPSAVEEARVALLAARRARIQPGVDDKVLTEWNAMAVATLAEAAAATGETRWADAAHEIAEVLFARLRRADGRWLRSLQADDARHLALAADYAWVLEAATRLAELTGRAIWTQRALEVAAAMLELFGPDPAEADRTLFSTGIDAPALIVRPKDLLDGALPSANAVAAHGLFRIAELSGDETLRDAALGILSSMAALVSDNPVAFCDLLPAVALAEGMVEVVVAGDRPDLVAVARSAWRPDTVLAWGEPTSSPLWSEREAGFAYVCRRYACRLPAADGATLARELAGPGG